MQDMEQAIRERAYHMWNDAGRPDGSSETFWLNAQRDLLESSLARIATVKPSRKATKAKSVTAPRKRKVA
jgi:hypothetical protein